jgi:hypothetical protein
LCEINSIVLASRTPSDLAHPHGKILAMNAALAPRMPDPNAAAGGFAVWRFLDAELWLRQSGIADA